MCRNCGILLAAEMGRLETIHKNNKKKINFLDIRRRTLINNFN